MIFLHWKEHSRSLNKFAQGYRKLLFIFLQMQSEPMSFECYCICSS